MCLFNFQNLNPFSMIDSNKISLSTEHKSQANQLIDRLNSMNDNNKVVTDFYLDVRLKVSEKLAFI